MTRITRRQALAAVIHLVFIFAVPVGFCGRFPIWVLPWSARVLILSNEHPETALTAAEGASLTSAPLFISLYAQLREMAEKTLKRNGARHMLSPTTLLHEAYIEIAARDSLLFPDRARFMGYASRAMRGLLLDFIREGKALKRGSAFEFTSLLPELDDEQLVCDHTALTRISDVLDELSALDAALAELVDLKFFCGFSLGEIAVMRCVSERTIQREWEKARLLLYQSLLHEQR